MVRPASRLAILFCLAAAPLAAQTGSNPQKVKITDGVDTATVTAAGELNTMCTAQPGVDIGTVSCNAGTNLNTSALALESGGNLAAAATSLAILDDWDESDRAKVNPIVGQAGVAANAGAASATTQRVIQASDSTLTVATANDSGTCFTITATSGTIIASNASRRGFILLAKSTNTAPIFVKFGATATTSNFPMAAGASITMMAGSLTYTGIVDAIRAGAIADQIACVVEF